MYPSDLNDAEWQAVAHHFDRPDPRGNPGKYAKRDIVNAILYMLKCRIPWRMMPKDFPPWDTVYDHYRRWIKRNIWPDALRAIRQEQASSSPIRLRSTASAFNKHVRLMQTPEPVSSNVPLAPNAPETQNDTVSHNEPVSHT